jgi:hypothetical protein
MPPPFLPPIATPSTPTPSRLGSSATKPYTKRLKIKKKLAVFWISILCFPSEELRWIIRWLRSENAAGNIVALLSTEDVFGLIESSSSSLPSEELDMAKLYNK